MPEPPRPKGHWDYLCEEMQWLSADFAQERRWKRGVARKVRLHLGLPFIFVSGWLFLVGRAGWKEVTQNSVGCVLMPYSQEASSSFLSFSALMVFFASDLGRRQGLALGVFTLAPHPAGGPHGDPAPRGAAAERGTGPEGGAGQAASNRLLHGQGRQAVLEQCGEGGLQGLGLELGATGLVGG